MENLQPRRLNARRLLIIGVVCAVASGVITSLFLFKSPKTNPDVLSTQTVLPSPPPLPEDLADLTSLTLLLLGYGGPGHEGGFLTDAIMVAQIDFESNKVSYISIPRDLWVVFPDGVSRKINSAFAHGGKLPEISTTDLDEEKADSGSGIVKSIVTNVTGLPINYFVAIDFVGLQRAIGQVLEGIEVDVPETLDDPWYPVEGRQLEPCDHTPEEIGELTEKYSGFELQKHFKCRYEHLYFEKGKTQMEGADVLKYVRSRHSSSDFGRSRRQVDVLLGVKNKLLKLKALDKAGEFFESLLYTIQTDLDVSVVKYLAPAIKSAKDFKIKTIHLDTTNVFKESKSSSGQSILLPKAGENNWKKVHDLIELEI